MIAQDKLNPAALAALPIAVLLTLSALLPYFGAEYYSSFDISGWSFFSSVDQLMVLSILLAAVLSIASLLPEFRDGSVRIALGGKEERAFEFPLIFVPAAAVAMLGALILCLIALRILFPPDGLSPSVGIFLGAFLAMALVASGAGAIVFEIAPSRAPGWAPAATPAGAHAAPVPPEEQPTRAMPAPAPPKAGAPSRETPAPPAVQPPPAAEPPPPAPETRRA